MLRISKLTDYGLVLLTHMARQDGGALTTAQDLAGLSHVPVPTVSKILKELTRAGIVASHRGRYGGYALARPTVSITVAEVIEALEGPFALTECTGTEGACSLEPTCVARERWAPISRAVHHTLQRLPVSALAPPADPITAPPSTPTLTVLNS